MRTARHVAALASLALLASPALAACGGDDAGAAAQDTASSAPSSAASSPSATPSIDTQSIGITAQGIGIEVGAYSVKNDFAIPADQADFEAKVKYDQGPDAVDVEPGSKVGYRKTGKNKFEICVVQLDGSTPVGWGLFDSVSGRATDGSGAPTSPTCPSA